MVSWETPLINYVHDKGKQVLRAI